MNIYEYGTSYTLGSSTTDQTKNNICEQRNKCDGLFIQAERNGISIFCQLAAAQQENDGFLKGIRLLMTCIVSFRPK